MGERGDGRERDGAYDGVAGRGGEQARLAGAMLIPAVHFGGESAREDCRVRVGLGRRGALEAGLPLWGRLLVSPS